MAKPKLKGPKQPAIDLDVIPLLPSVGKYEDLLVRFEKMPFGSSLSKGHNNGDGSWSVRSRDLEDLMYYPADGDLNPHTLFLRIIGLDGDSATVLGSLDMEIKPARAPIEGLDIDLDQEIGERLDAALAQVEEKLAAQLDEAKTSWSEQLAELAQSAQPELNIDDEALEQRLRERAEEAVQSIASKADDALAASEKRAADLDAQLKKADGLFGKIDQAVAEALKKIADRQASAEESLSAAPRDGEPAADAGQIEALRRELAEIKEQSDAAKADLKSVSENLAQRIDKIQKGVLDQVEVKFSNYQDEIKKSAETAGKSAREDVQATLDEVKSDLKAVSKTATGTAERFEKLEQDLQARLKDARTQQEASTGERIAKAVKDAQAAVDQSVAQQLDGRLEADRKRHEQTVAAAVKDVQEKLQKRLDSNLKALSDELGAVKDQSNGFAETVKAIQDKLQTRLDSELQALAGELGQIKDQSNGFAEALKVMEARTIEQFKADQEQALHGLKTDLSGKIDALQQQIPTSDIADIRSALDKTRSDHEAKAAALAKELQALREQTEKQTAVARSVELDLARTHERQLAEVKETIAKELKDLALENASDVTAAQLRAAKQEVAEALSAKIKKLGEEVQSFKDQTDRVAVTGQEVERRLKDEQAQALADLKQELTDQLTAIAKKADDNSALANLKKELTQQLEAMTPKGDDKAVAKQVKSLRKELEDKLASAVQPLAAGLEALKKQVAGHEKASGDLESRLTKQYRQELDKLRDALQAQVKMHTGDAVDDAEIANWREQQDSAYAELVDDLAALKQQVDELREAPKAANGAAPIDDGLEERLREEQIRRLAEMRDSIMRQLQDRNADDAPVAAIEEMKRAQSNLQAQVEDRLQSLTNALKAVKADAEKHSLASQSTSQIEERLKAEQARKIAELNEKFNQQIKERIEAEAKLQHAINTKASAPAPAAGSADAPASSELESRIKSLMEEVAALKARPAAGLSDVQDAKRSVETKLRSEQVSRFSETREEFARLLNDKLSGAEERLIGEIEKKLQNAGSTAEQAALEASKTVEAQGTKLRDRIIGVESRAAAAEVTAKDVAKMMGEIKKRLDEMEWAIDKMSGRGVGGAFSLKRFSRQAAGVTVAALCLLGIIAYSTPVIFARTGDAPTPEAPAD